MLIRVRSLWGLVFFSSGGELVLISESMGCHGYGLFKGVIYLHKAWLTDPSRQSSEQISEVSEECQESSRID